MFRQLLWVVFRTEVEPQLLASRFLSFPGKSNTSLPQHLPSFYTVNFSFMSAPTFGWDGGRARVWPSALISKAIHLARGAYSHGAIFTFCSKPTYKWQVFGVLLPHYASPSVLSELHCSAFFWNALNWIRFGVSLTCHSSFWIYHFSDWMCLCTRCPLLSGTHTVTSPHPQSTRSSPFTDTLKGSIKHHYIKFNISNLFYDGHHLVPESSSSKELLPLTRTSGNRLYSSHISEVELYWRLSLANQRQVFKVKIGTI